MWQRAGYNRLSATSCRSAATTATAVAGVSLVVLTPLALAKRRLGGQIGSRALPCVPSAAGLPA